MPLENISPRPREKPRHGIWIMVVLGILTGIGSLSTDLYLPALPRMAVALDAPRGVVEWTIGEYLVGFSLGQLLWGAIGDRYGRRGPIAVGLLLFSIGSSWRVSPQRLDGEVCSALPYPCLPIVPCRA